MYDAPMLDLGEVPATLLDCFEEVEVQCGAPWKRITERGELVGRGTRPGKPFHLTPQGYLRDGKSRCGDSSVTNLGWQPTCAHDLEPVPCTVLDPFAGSGTVGRVALRHRRNAALIELNPEYCELIEKRIYGVQVALPMDGESA